jgi:hypothetical protein
MVLNPGSSSGLTTLGPNRRWGAHTQIWNGTTPENQLINASSGQDATNTKVVKVIETISSSPPSLAPVDSTQLWDLGSGYVRAMQEVPLDADPVLRPRSR